MISVKRRINWLYPPSQLIELLNFCCLQRGKLAEAEIEFERILGSSHVESAMLELSKSDKGDETESVKISELLHGRHSRGKENEFLV